MKSQLQTSVCIRDGTFPFTNWDLSICVCVHEWNKMEYKTHKCGRHIDWLVGGQWFISTMITEGSIIVNGCWKTNNHLRWPHCVPEWCGQLSLAQWIQMADTCQTRKKKTFERTVKMDDHSSEWAKQLLCLMLLWLFGDVDVGVPSRPTVSVLSFNVKNR